MKRRQMIAIGCTVLLALFFLVRAILFLHPTPGDGKQRLHVRFTSVEKIAPGTRVAFAGKPVGEVVRVTPIPDVIERSQQNAPIFPYEVVLSIDSSITVYRTDEIAVKTSGLMGERFIVITPKPFPIGHCGALVTPTDILYALPTESAEQTLQDVSTVAQRADETLSVLTRLIKDNHENISATTQSLMQASASLEEMLSTLQGNNFAEKMSALAEKASSCADQMNTVAQKLSKATEGTGTLGQFIKNPNLYNKAVDCLNEVSQLTRDLNSYGLFFHTNRDWQRELALRKEVAAAQKSPQSLHIQQGFSSVIETLGAIESSLDQAKRALDERDFVNDKKAKDEFAKQIDDIQKELDSLHKAIENLEIGNIEPEGSINHG